MSSSTLHFVLYSLLTFLLTIYHIPCQIKGIKFTLHQMAFGVAQKEEALK